MISNYIQGRNKKIIYLDTACMGLADQSVLDSMREVLTHYEHMTTSPTDFTVDLYGYMPRARLEIAKLINANVDEIALVESTSHGLGMIANSITLRRADNILVCDLEFLSSSLCWFRRQQEVGFEIRPVATSKGVVRVEDFEARIDRNTRVIIVSAVQEINGYRVDLKELSKLSRKNNILLVVDGIQEVGALKVDLRDVDVDIYCAGGHKWLRNPFGMGFLYVNKRIVEKLEPNFYSYFNIIEPENGWREYLECPNRTPFDELELVKTAQKFETGGTGNYGGALGLYKSCQIINSLGIDRVEQKILELKDHLTGGLRELPVNLTIVDHKKSRSGITNFSLPQGLIKEKELNEFLKQNKIYVSLRYTSDIGGIRVSPHYYNTLEDINKLLEGISLFCR